MMSVIIYVGNVLFDRKIRQTLKKQDYSQHVSTQWLDKPSTLSKQTYDIDFNKIIALFQISFKSTPLCGLFSIQRKCPLS